MVRESSLEDTRSILVDGESSDSSFEIKIKTLDLQTHSFRVNKNMPVSSLKEEIVTKIGVPLEKQLLLYKAKALNDNQLLSELNLTDGDTMHLVERQGGQFQPISSTVASATSRSSSRQDAGAESSHNRSRTRSTDSVLRRFRFLNRPTSSLPFGRSPWISNSDELFPETMTTISDFIDRMNGEFRSCCNSLNSLNSLSNDEHHLLSTNTITETSSVLEVLSIILWRTEQLLRENATTALSNLSTHLQRIDSIDDQSLRGQTQLEAAQLGFAMQHLGAMFLELGRAAMSLRIGRRPGGSFIQADHAVYISPTGPNPMIVEQFPYQSDHPFGLHRRHHFHYRQEESVPVLSLSRIAGLAVRTVSPSGSNSVPRPEGQATASRTQSDTGNEGMSLSDLDLSRQFEHQVDLDESEPGNFIGLFFENAVREHGEQSVYEDLVELSNVQFANEFMEFLNTYFTRRGYTGRLHIEVPPVSAPNNVTRRRRRRGRAWDFFAI